MKSKVLNHLLTAISKINKNASMYVKSSLFRVGKKITLLILPKKVIYHNPYTNSKDPEKISK